MVKAEKTVGSAEEAVKCRFDGVEVDRGGWDVAEDVGWRDGGLWNREDGRNNRQKKLSDDVVAGAVN